MLRPLYESSTLHAQKTTMAVRLLFLSDDLHSKPLLLFLDISVFFLLRAVVSCTGISFSFMQNLGLKMMEVGF